MKTLLRILFLAAMMLPLASCGGGEAESSHDGQEAVESPHAGDAAEASEASADAATDLDGAAAAVVCCEGNCNTPAGTCCSDGTCNGKHVELPLAP